MFGVQLKYRGSKLTDRSVNDDGRAFLPNTVFSNKSLA